MGVARSSRITIRAVISRITLSVLAVQPRRVVKRGKSRQGDRNLPAVNGLLEALAELPLVERTSVDTGKLKQVADQLSTLIGKTDKLVTLLENPNQSDNTVTEESSGQAELVEKIVTAMDEGPRSRQHRFRSS